MLSSHSGLKYLLKYSIKGFEEGDMLEGSSKITGRLGEKWRDQSYYPGINGVRVI